jgi:hypothetical protein
VEECNQRRAKRAGLEGTLPAGRPMTERELDMLSEALGDGTGSRTKRKRKIEEMMIEDMEAEIRETNAVIKRRRRAGTGLLPMPLALLMCLMVSSVKGFTACDCSNRSNVLEAYSLLEPDTCANVGKDGEVETTVYGEIVQIKQDRMIPVFRVLLLRPWWRSTAACSQQQELLNTSGSGSSSLSKPGSAGRRGRAARSSSTGGR